MTGHDTSIDRLRDSTSKVLLASHGSTSTITRLIGEPGWVTKSLRIWDDTGAVSEDGLHALKTETEILSLLNGHPRVVEFGGVIEEHNGLRLKEAVNGDLQVYLRSHDGDEQIDKPRRLKWCQQAAEALVYIHSKNVIHCDLRPDNFLLNDSFDLCLCDFGGSVWGDIDGNRIPDPGFYDPRSSIDTITPAIDIFALGSVMYVIMTGCYPHGSPKPLVTWEEREAYEDVVNKQFSRGNFPDMKDLSIARVIQGCWTGRLVSASEILAELLKQ